MHVNLGDSSSYDLCRSKCEFLLCQLIIIIIDSAFVYTSRNATSFLCGGHPLFAQTSYVRHIICMHMYIGVASLKDNALGQVELCYKCKGRNRFELVTFESDLRISELKLSYVNRIHFL